MTVRDYLSKVLLENTECYNCPVENDCYNASKCTDFLLEKFLEEEYDE